MRLLLGLLMVISQFASADAQYQLGQAGSYMAMCGPGKFQNACQIYLAGYRAGIHDLQREVQDVARMKINYCETASVEAASFCKANAEDLVIPLYEGCGNEGMKLPANVVHQIISNYIDAHPAALKELFSRVYKDAMAETFPCK